MVWVMHPLQRVMQAHMLQSLIQHALMRLLAGMGIGSMANVLVCA